MAQGRKKGLREGSLLCCCGSPAPSSFVPCLSVYDYSSPIYDKKVLDTVLKLYVKFYVGSLYCCVRRKHEKTNRISGHYRLCDYGLTFLICFVLARGRHEQLLHPFRLCKRRKTKILKAFPFPLCQERTTML